MKNKLIIFPVLSIILVGLIFYGQSKISKQEVILQTPTPKEEQREFEIEKNPVENTLRGTSNSILTSIDFGNGKKIVQSVTAKTVYDALQIVAGENKLEIKTKDYKFGKMVESIGNTQNNKTAYWSYSVNGKAGQISADRFEIKPGDNIEWKFIKM